MLLAKFMKIRCTQKISVLQYRPQMSFPHAVKPKNWLSVISSLNTARWFELNNNVRVQRFFVLLCNNWANLCIERSGSTIEIKHLVCVFTIAAMQQVCTDHYTCTTLSPADKSYIIMRQVRTDHYTCTTLSPADKSCVTMHRRRHHGSTCNSVALNSTRHGFDDDNNMTINHSSH